MVYISGDNSKVQLLLSRGVIMAGLLVRGSARAHLYTQTHRRTHTNTHMSIVTWIRSYTLMYTRAANIINKILLNPWFRFGRVSANRRRVISLSD